jgi:hypothetical protein
MALAVDPSTPLKKTGTGPLTTDQFSPPANSSLWVFAGTDENSGVTNNLTVSGAGLTWSLIKRCNFGTVPGGNGGAEIWHAYTVSALTNQTVTVTQNVNNDLAFQVVVFTGAESTPGGATNSAASVNGLPSAAVTTTRDNSWVWAVVNDWNAAGAGTYPAGQSSYGTEPLHHLAGQITTHLWRTDAVTATPQSVTLNQTAPTQQYVMAMVEIRETTVAQAPPRRIQVGPSHAVIRAANY